MRVRFATLFALVALAAACLAPAGADARSGPLAAKAHNVTPRAHASHHHRKGHKSRAEARRLARSKAARRRRAARRRVARKPAVPTTPAATAPPTGGASTSCTDTDVAPDAVGLAAASAAVLCLVNRERAAHDEVALVSNSKLLAAATAHSADQVAKHYFAHDSLDGRSMVDRVSAAGWSTAGAWRTGENIAWGTGSYATPRHIVEGWMNSPGHRANILDGHFREAGSGVALGTPQRGTVGGATYTLDLGAHG
jgi:uncharacterized protein YkwD